VERPGPIEDGDVEIAAVSPLQVKGVQKVPWSDESEHWSQCLWGFERGDRLLQVACQVSAYKLADSLAKTGATLPFAHNSLSCQITSVSSEELALIHLLLDCPVRASSACHLWHYFFHF